MDQPDLRLVESRAQTKTGEPTDDELMLLARANHQDAFELLVRRYQRLVLGLATRFLGDCGLGRDVAQDVFLAIWEERAEYQARDRFRSYLVAVTLHRCQFVARQARTRMRKLDDVAAQGNPTPAPSNEALHALIEEERRRAVHEKLTRIPEKMREVMILRFTHELPLSEIALVTGLSEGTVKSHLSRGIQRLHHLMGREDSL